MRINDGPSLTTLYGECSLTVYHFYCLVVFLYPLVDYLTFPFSPTGLFFFFFNPNFTLQHPIERHRPTVISGQKVQSYLPYSTPVPGFWDQFFSS